jgi:hypothetical protein
VAGAAAIGAGLLCPADRRCSRSSTVTHPYLTCGSKLRRGQETALANSATIRDANGLPATFAGSKTGQDDAPFVFVKVGTEERRMRWAEWDALPPWTGPRPARAAKDQ